MAGGEGGGFGGLYPGEGGLGVTFDLEVRAREEANKRRLNRCFVVALVVAAIAFLLTLVFGSIPTTLAGWAMGISVILLGGGSSLMLLLRLTRHNVGH